MRKKTQELTEITSERKTERESKIKEAQQTMQSDHAKVLRKLEVKISDMKKMIKELRGKLNEKESRCSELETSLQDAKTEVDQAKLLQESSDSLNLSLGESEVKIKELIDSLAYKEQQFVMEKEQLVGSFKREISEINEKVVLLNNDIGVKNNEICEWKKKHEKMNSTLTDNAAASQNEIVIKEEEIRNCKSRIITFEDELLVVVTELTTEREYAKKIQIQLNEANDMIQRQHLATEKIKCEKDDLNKEMKCMLGKLKSEEDVLKKELHNLKTQFACVEGELKELNQQYNDKLNENETLMKRLENSHKEIKLKEEECNYTLSCKEGEYNLLQEKYEKLEAEGQNIEVLYNSKINEMRLLHKEYVSNIEKENEAKLEEKDIEFRRQMNTFIHDKDVSVERVTEKLDEMRQQQFADLENRYKLQIDEINNEWKSKVNLLEIKYAEDKNRGEVDTRNVLSERKEVIDKLKEEVKFLKENQKQLRDTHESEMLHVTSENKRLKLKGEETMDAYKEREETFRVEIQKHLDENKKDLVASHATSKEEIEKIRSEYESEISSYKRMVHEMEKSKCVDLNELSSSHDEDRNILLRQVDELSVNLKQMQELCSQKDKEYTMLSEKLEIETLQLSEANKLGTLEMQQKIEECEKTWKEKQVTIEKKYKKIIGDRDKKNKVLLEEVKLQHNDTLKLIESNNNSEMVKLSNQILEKNQEIKLLNIKLDDVNVILKDNEEQYKNQIEVHKSREKEAWSQLEQITHERNQEIGIAETNLLECKSTIESLQLQIMSNEDNSKFVDVKLPELLQEKSNLEREKSEMEHSYEEKILALQNEFDQSREKFYNLEKEKEVEILSKISECEEISREKLLDMKKKAENKIGKMKKDYNEKLSQAQSRTLELENNNSELKSRLDEELLSFEKQINELKEQHNNILTDNEEKLQTEQNKLKEELDDKLSKKLEELQNTSNQDKDIVNIELIKVKEEILIKTEKVTQLQDEILIKTEKITQLEERIDNMVVDKMDCLKSLREDLFEEHQTGLNRIQDDANKMSEILEKKCNAKVDEKEFEYSSRVKQMIKEFQIQMGSKDREVQEAVQQAIEVAQVDERRIICEYDEQIMEMQKELRLREKDMLDLQSETERQLDQLYEEKETIEREHKDAVEKLEQDYHQRLEDLVKRHEEELLKATYKNVSVEETETRLNEQMNDIEKSYVAKLQEMEEQHRNNTLAQEKKHKMQLKKTKTEMRKLLAEKGVVVTNGYQWDSTSGPSSAVSVSSS